MVYRAKVIESAADIQKKKGILPITKKTRKEGRSFFVAYRIEKFVKKMSLSFKTTENPV